MYADDPLNFALDVLGVPLWSPDRPDIPGLTPEQAELLIAAIDERQITARSGHGIGKSFVLAILVLWWLYARQGLVVTTASTWDQIIDVLWREIAGLHRKARTKLPGQLLQTELRVSPEWFAIGRSVKDPTAFQGRHHKFLLVVVDEAPGVPEEVHEGISSLCTGERNCIVMVGNPTLSSGTFWDSHRKGNWKRFHFSSLNHPNVLLGREVIPGAVTRQWVEEQKLKWGEDSPVYASRVLGEFPTGGNRNVYPIKWVDRAMDPARYEARVEAVDPHEPVIIFGDIARFGEDKSVMAVRRGGAVVHLEGWGHSDTMETAGRIFREWEDRQAQLVIIDEVGLGAGVLDRLIELGVPAVGFNSGRPAQTKSQFNNRRSELAWQFREMLEKDLIALPEVEQLRADLISIAYRINSTGKIEVESKADMKARGMSSPDWSDAVVGCWAMDGDLAIDPQQPFVLDKDHTLIPGDPEFQTRGFVEGSFADWM